MPNIEMYGFGKSNEDVFRGNQERILAIIRALDKLGLTNETVVTKVISFSSYAKDFFVLKGGHDLVPDRVLIKKDTPFIRICSTDPEEIQKIIAELKKAKIGIDIEYLVLTGFIPAEEMR